MDLLTFLPEGHADSVRLFQVADAALLVALHQRQQYNSALFLCSVLFSFPHISASSEILLVLSWCFTSTETVRFIRDWHINTLPDTPFISAPVHFTSVQHGDGNPPVKHSGILLTSLDHYCRHADSVSLCQAKLTLTSLGHGSASLR